jgi:hypothetical protein
MIVEGVRQDCVFKLDWEVRPKIRALLPPLPRLHQPHPFDDIKIWRFPGPKPFLHELRLPGLEVSARVTVLW